MPDIDGRIKRRVALVAATEQTVTFDQGCTAFSVVKLIGSGQVAFKFDKTIASISDDESILLVNDVPGLTWELRHPFSKMSFISDANMTIQVLVS